MRGRAGERRVAFADFHRLPADTPERDSCLAVDELVTAIELPAPRFARHCHYLKVRDRASYAFALVFGGGGLGTGRRAHLGTAPGAQRRGPQAMAPRRTGGTFQGPPGEPGQLCPLAERCCGRQAAGPQRLQDRIGGNAIVRALEEAHWRGSANEQPATQHRASPRSRRRASQGHRPGSLRRRISCRRPAPRQRGQQRRRPRPGARHRLLRRPWRYPGWSRYCIT